MSYWDHSQWADQVFNDLAFRGNGPEGGALTAWNSMAWRHEAWNPEYWYDTFSHWIYGGDKPPGDALRYYGSGRWLRQQQRKKAPKTKREESADEIWLLHEKWREILEAKAEREQLKRKDAQGFIEALLMQIKEELDIDLEFAKVATAKVLAEMLGIGRQMRIKDDEALVVAMQLVDMEINNG